MKKSLDKLIRPQSVAIVGVSERKDAAGSKLYRNLKDIGYRGEIFLVNPKYDALDGVKCYPSLASLPKAADVAFLGVPAAAGPQLLDEAAHAGIKAVVLNANGYADGDADGVALQKRLQETARKHDVLVCGPNNLGFINVQDQVALWTPAHFPKLNRGPVGVVSQSGSVALILSEDERDLGFSYLVTTGNEAVTTVADYLTEMVDDQRVKVILLFLETIRDPGGFAAAAQKAAAAGKPIIALKLGRSAQGRSLVQAHTGSIAGEDSLYDAFFRAHGVIRVADLDEMLECAVMLSKYPAPIGNPNTAIVTLSGGEAALIADVCADAGFDLPELAQATRAAMRPAFPSHSSINNPVDAWGLGFNEERFKIVLDALLADASLSTIAFAVDAPGRGGGDVHIALVMAKVCAQARTDKRLVFFNNTSGNGANQELRRELDKVGVPYLSGIRPAVLALRNAAAPWRLKVAAPAAVAKSGGDLPADEPGRFDALTLAGVPMSASRIVRSADEAVAVAQQFGAPLVLKGIASDLPHKSDLGLVKLQLKDAQAVETAYRSIDAALAKASKAPDRGVVAQPMAQEGVELILGMRNDPGLGSFIIVGPGGIFVDFGGKASVRVAPVSVEVAKEMLHETVAAKLLKGVRGKGPWDLDSAALAISNFSKFGAARAHAFSTMEINPLIVNRQGAVGVDFLAEETKR